MAQITIHHHKPRCLLSFWSVDPGNWVDPPLLLHFWRYPAMAGCLKCWSVATLRLSSPEGICTIVLTPNGRFGCFWHARMMHWLPRHVHWCWSAMGVATLVLCFVAISWPHMSSHVCGFNRSPSDRCTRVTLGPNYARAPVGMIVSHLVVPSVSSAAQSDSVLL